MKSRAYLPLLRLATLFSRIKNARQVLLNAVIFQFLRIKEMPTEENKASAELQEILADTIVKPAILQEPEKTVLAQLREQLVNMRMLDLGVGSGRTTQHFACLVKEYFGVDYSYNMIEACRKIFSNYPKTLSFVKADASNLAIFPDNFFDFILFSYNGIDYSDPQKRKQILQEIWRVLKPEGYFCFSTHNLDCTDYCVPRFSRNPISIAESVTRLVCMRVANRKVWKTMRNRSSGQEYAVVNDGVWNFAFQTYYITLAAQVHQLNETGFSVINVYGLSDGLPVESLSENTSQWLYYLVQAQKPKITASSDAKETSTK